MWRFEPRKNVYFSTQTLIHLSHRFTNASKPAAQTYFDCCIGHLTHLRFNLSVISKIFATKVVFIGPNISKSLGAKIRAVKAVVQGVPTVVLEFSPGLVRLYAAWRCHDEAVSILPVGLDGFCKLHPEASRELYSTIRNSHFHHASENGPVLHENPQTR
jgi:hypothetical protein